MTETVRLEDVEVTLARSLAVWAAGSVIVGAAAMASGRARGDEERVRFGRQTAAWGAVDGAIAAAAAIGRARRSEDEATERRSTRLRRLLLINAVADVAYVAGGAAIALRARRSESSSRLGVGDGVAIVIQGAFLLVLDLSQARRLA